MNDVDALASKCPDPADIAALCTTRPLGAQLRALTAHLTRCAPCRRRLWTSAATLSPLCPCDPTSDSLAQTHALSPGASISLAVGTKVGRHVVAERLGAGGMGVVYAAYDPELDRKVALKLMHPGTAIDESAPVEGRLLHEARSMARLAHPNVVTVYDADTFRSHVFIAMELVEGETLASWLRAAPRRLAEVLAMFCAAGEGLAAAHAAGLVHRDFKPENVLVGRDGRARVGDFGLARGPWVVHGEGETAAVAPEQGGAHTLLAGTPYYIAPEQLLGRPADARSDQFSFCVALYAALTGMHPFDATSQKAQDGAPSASVRPRPRCQDPMPAWLRATLWRGLSIDPAARFSSMTALLDALRRPRARWKWWLSGAAAVALAAVAAMLLRPGPPAACTGAELAWADVWSGARADALEAAFQATGTPYAGHAAAHMRRALDAYGGAWMAMHTEACEATHVHRVQSEELLDKRMMCLQSRLRDVRALIDRLVAANVDAVERAPRAPLSEIESCADLAALTSQVPLPQGAATRARVTAVRSALSALQAARLSGQSDEARARVRQLVADARALHYRPLEAEVLLEQGMLEDRAGDYAAARAAFTDAVWSAEAGRHDALTARAWTRLMFVDGYRLGHHAEALRLRPRVTALLARLGDDDEIAGMLHLVSAQLLSRLDRIAEARAEAEEAHGRFERRFGPDDLRVADALDELGQYAESESPAEARRVYERGLAIRRGVYGDDHPEVASALNSIASTYYYERNYTEARATYARAMAIFEHAFAHQHPNLAKIAHNLGLVALSQAQWDEAVALHRRAVDTAARAFGRAHPDYGRFLAWLGIALTQVQRHDDALSALEEALDVLVRGLGPDHTNVATCLEGLAELQVAMRRYADARASAARSVAILEKRHGAASPALRNSLLLLGQAELGLARPTRAIAPLQRAHALASSEDAVQEAQIGFALARALVAGKNERARGFALARTVLQDLREQHGSHALEREIIRFLRVKGG